MAKQLYIDKGFKELDIGFLPDHIYNLENNIQGKIKQNLLKHHIAGTIHSAVGDMLTSVSASIALHYSY